MKTKNKELNLEKKVGFGNSIKNKVKKGFEITYKLCKNREAQFFFYLMLSTVVASIGANESRKAREEYTGNNPLYERVQTINNQLNAKTTFQYKDIGQICDSIYQKQEQVQELLAERDSITQLPIYLQQTEKIEQVKKLKQIGWGIPLFAGLMGAGSVLLSLGFYVDEKYGNNEEEN